MSEMVSKTRSRETKEGIPFDYPGASPTFQGNYTEEAQLNKIFFSHASAYEQNTQTYKHQERPIVHVVHPKTQIFYWQKTPLKDRLKWNSCFYMLALILVASLFTSFFFWELMDSNKQSPSPTKQEYQTEKLADTELLSAKKEESTEAFDHLELETSTIAVETTTRFSYTTMEQYRWAKDFEGCDGRYQSPIDIKTRSVMENPLLEEPFLFQGPWSEKVSAKVEDSGHDYKITLLEQYAKISSEFRGYRLSGGGLSWSPYNLLQFHFHWGSHAQLGSEHTLDGKRYHGEAHFVFQSEHLTEGHGALAVLGFFIDVIGSRRPNTGSLDDVFEATSQLENFGDSLMLNNSLRLDTIIPMHDIDKMSRFYRYDGSLTTPPCSQIVEWTVFQDPIYITREQYDMLLAGKDVNGDPLMSNYRWLQDLNGRPVWRSPRA